MQQLAGTASIVSASETEREDGVAESGLQLARRSFGDDLAVVDDHELLAKTVGLFEVLRREQHRSAAFDESLDDRPEVLATLGIEAGRRFVEKEQWGIGDERRGEVEPASHAARVGLAGAVGGVTESKSLEQLLGALHHVGLLEVVEQSDHPQVLESGEVLIDRGELAS